ncbi:MAG: nicotinate-nucleotide--dimethylbenzimidazole phosphoribosyltransferase, partial [Lachnospiraceae bacterium]|nr:nicotinate-nucleotide--dimethylbenzimidazole phosphoribosyltransferase [Lachnospiraceae bacterium]
MKRLERVTELNREAMECARVQWNRIAKPLHSFGALEEDIVRLAGVFGTADVRLKKRAVVVMCADHGVVEEGVTQSGSEVTEIVAAAMARGNGNINCLGDVYRAEVIPVDIGMVGEVIEKGPLQCKIAHGTGNIAKGAAMTREQAEAALKIGMDVVKQCKDKGFDILVTGEMGIGNTTPASAIAAVLLGEEVEKVTGRGAGLDKEGLQRKYRAVSQAIEVNRFARLYRERKGGKKQMIGRDCMLDLLSGLGGYDIAGMAGLFLGGAVYRLPVVIDGFISAVAAAAAVGICPAAGCCWAAAGAGAGVGAGAAL